jgi:hypothetical protein
MSPICFGKRTRPEEKPDRPVPRLFIDEADNTLTVDLNTGKFRLSSERSPFKPKTPTERYLSELNQVLKDNQ